MSDRRSQISGVDPEVSDEELMRRYIDGDDAAFEIVYRRRREGLRRFCWRQSGSEAVGAELAQEVWFKLIRACQNGRYRVDGKFTTFLYRLARNQVIDWYRRQGGREMVEFDESVPESGDAIVEDRFQVRDPEKLYADREKLRAVLEGIAELSEVQRATLLMHLETDMSYEEIAEAMNTKRETVKTRLRYARQILKQRVFDG